MTAASALVPVVGLATAPILAQALGVGGRGELAVAVAPNLLIVGVATLGLPEALTFHLARRPSRTHRALLLAALMTTGIGMACVAAVMIFASTLAGGDRPLGQLVVLAAVLSLPALGVSLLRGAASGRQMWTAVATERVVTSVLRLGLLGGLAIVGRLDVLGAVLITALCPVAAGLVYWRLFLPVRDGFPHECAGSGGQLLPDLMGYGTRLWLGALASVVMARLSQVVTAPMSSVEQLGLLVVAITISDVPFIVAQTIRDVVFGADSSRNDPDRLALVSRLTTLGAVVSSLLIGGSAWWWLGPLFGTEFRGALWPTIVLLVSTVVTVPGLLAGAGLASSGRPGARSAALVASLVANVAGLVLLVPAHGALGAAWAAFAASAVSTAVGVGALSRAQGRKFSDFLLPAPKEVAALTRIVREPVRRRTRRRSIGR